MASSRIPMVLDLEGTPRAIRTPASSEGNSQSDPNHEPRESAVGRAEDSQRTSETRHQDLAGLCGQIHGPKSETAISDLENVSRQSHIPTCFDRLFHGSHHLVSYSVRVCCPC